MRDKWYADNRDLVKWGALVHLAQKYGNEFYITVTAKLKPGMTKKEAREEVRDLLSWQPLAVHPAVLVRSWDVQDKYSLSFWDSMIVASAELQGCKYILSEDFNDGQEFFGAKVVNPFVLTPGDI
jgi:predicted nucleic acid-binding protein